VFRPIIYFRTWPGRDKYGGGGGDADDDGRQFHCLSIPFASRPFDKNSFSVSGTGASIAHGTYTVFSARHEERGEGHHQHGLVAVGERVDGQRFVQRRSRVVPRSQDGNGVFTNVPFLFRLSHSFLGLLPAGVSTGWHGRARSYYL